MSATLNAELFVKYFADMEEAGTVEIPGRMFDIDQVWIEDLIGEGILGSKDTKHEIGPFGDDFDALKIDDTGCFCKNVTKMFEDG